MREGGGSVPSHVEQKTLKFEALLNALRVRETDWPAWSQDDGHRLAWDITAYTWRDVSVG